MYVYDAVDFPGRTAAEWQTNIIRAEASATHAAELQAQMASINFQMVIQPINLATPSP